MWIRYFIWLKISKLTVCAYQLCIFIHIKFGVQWECKFKSSFSIFLYIQLINVKETLGGTNDNIYTNNSWEDFNIYQILERFSLAGLSRVTFYVCIRVTGFLSI